ncbi:MAG: hypothetical protein KDC53_22630 [Saprospiraceae bacterium]|nr:hypothetical protein [Saprospiraceae bacterium]
MLLSGLLAIGLVDAQNIPVGVRFDTNTLIRKGNFGDNWCQTWAMDDQVYTMLDDGNGWWGTPEKLKSLSDWEGAMLLRISGNQNFTKEDVAKMPGWPVSVVNSPLYAYGTVAVDSTIYIWLWKSETDTWYNRPVANRLLYTKDFGKSVYRWDGKLETYETYHSLDSQAFFFYKEDPRPKEGQYAYAFNWIAFLQNGKANTAAKDDYIYMYSPEQFNPRHLALARVPKDHIRDKAHYEYFQNIKNGVPQWTENLHDREFTIEFPAAGPGQDWMWPSWFPSVVYNSGLDLYIMTSYGIKDPNRKYWEGWCWDCPLPGSIGFWYAKNPWGPWKQFYYNESFYPDDPHNRTYGLKLSPKWISDDGTKMVLIWSDAGYDHSTYYKWNQMEIEILTK